MYSRTNELNYAAERHGSRIETRMVPAAVVHRMDSVGSFDCLCASQARAVPGAVSVDVAVSAAAVIVTVVVAAGSVDSIEQDTAGPILEYDWEGCLRPYQRISKVPLEPGSHHSTSPVAYSARFFFGRVVDFPASSVLLPVSACLPQLSLGANCAWIRLVLPTAKGEPANFPGTDLSTGRDQEVLNSIQVVLVGPDANCSCCFLKH